MTRRPSGNWVDAADPLGGPGTVSPPHGAQDDSAKSAVKWRFTDDYHNNLPTLSWPSLPLRCLRTAEMLRSNSSKVDLLVELGLPRTMAEDIETVVMGEGDLELGEAIRYVFDIDRAFTAYFRSGKLSGLAGVGMGSEIAKEAYERYLAYGPPNSGDGAARVKWLQDAGTGKLIVDWLAQLEKAVDDGTASVSERRDLNAIRDAGRAALSDNIAAIPEAVDRMCSDIRDFKREIGDLEQEIARYHRMVAKFTDMPKATRPKP